MAFGEAGLRKRLEPRQPAELLLREGGRLAVGGVGDDGVGHGVPPAQGCIWPARAGATARARKPATARIWNDRKATSCDSVMMLSVNQPAPMSACKATGSESRG